MGIFSKKQKQLNDAPAQELRGAEVRTESEPKKSSPEAVQLIEKYLSGNWDRVKIQTGDLVYINLNRDIEGAALEEKLIQNGVQQGWGKADTKLIITDEKYIQSKIKLVADAIKWNIPICDMQTFSQENASLAPDMETRARFLDWLMSQSYDLDSAFSSFMGHVKGMKSGGEVIPGLAYAPSLYRHLDKLVFVDKRKEATDLIIRDLGAEENDGFVVVCDLYLTNSESRELSVRYKNLEVGQINQRDYETFKYHFDNQAATKLAIVGVRNSKGKLQAHIGSWFWG